WHTKGARGKFFGNNNYVTNIFSGNKDNHPDLKMFHSAAMERTSVIAIHEKNRKATLTIQNLINRGKSTAFRQNWYTFARTYIVLVVRAIIGFDEFYKLVEVFTLSEQGNREGAYLLHVTWIGQGINLAHLCRAASCSSPRCMHDAVY
ncbi:unnamed protein product, partial [Allacma fusca]